MNRKSNNNNNNQVSLNVEHHQPNVLRPQNNQNNKKNSSGSCQRSTPQRHFNLASYVKPSKNAEAKDLPSSNMPKNAGAKGVQAPFTNRSGFYAKPSLTQDQFLLNLVMFFKADHIPDPKNPDTDNICYYDAKRKGLIYHFNGASGFRACKENDVKELKQYIQDQREANKRTRLLEEQRKYQQNHLPITAMPYMPPTVHTPAFNMGMMRSNNYPAPFYNNYQPQTRNSYMPPVSATGRFQNNFRDNRRYDKNSDGYISQNGSAEVWTRRVTPPPQSVQHSPSPTVPSPEIHPLAGLDDLIFKQHVNESNNSLPSSDKSDYWSTFFDSTWGPPHSPQPNTQGCIDSPWGSGLNGWASHSLQTPARDVPTDSPSSSDSEAWIKASSLLSNGTSKIVGHHRRSGSSEMSPCNSGSSTTINSSISGTSPPFSTLKEQQKTELDDYLDEICGRRFDDVLKCWNFS